MPDHVLMRLLNSPHFYALERRALASPTGWVEQWRVRMVSGQHLTVFEGSTLTEVVQATWHVCGEAEGKA